MSYVAEILVGHPTQTVLDQADRLFVQKILTHREVPELCVAVREAAPLLDDSTTAAVEIAVTDTKVVKVCKYRPTAGVAKGEKVHVVKQELQPGEAFINELERLKANGLTAAEAADQLIREHPELWQEYVEVMRQGRLHAPSLPPDAPTSPDAGLTLKAALTEVDTVCKTTGQTRHAALAALAKKDPKWYYKVYREYVLGQGLRDFAAAQIAALQEPR